MSPKKPEPPRRDRQGFYTLPDKTKCLSVTNVKKLGVPNDLTGWAGWEAGLCAVESLPRIIRARGKSERRKVAYWIGQAADRKRNDAAALGSAVHDKIEAHILGQPYDPPTPEQEPYLAAFFRFLQRELPVFEATELVLANPEDGWAGTADAYLTLPRLGAGLLLGDWKSGSGVYADFALQLAAYRRATVGWLKDGTQIVPPATQDAVVIHIRPDKYPDTGYRIYPVDTSDEVYDCFLAAQKTAVKWAKGLATTALGEAYDPTCDVEAA